MIFIAMGLPLFSDSITRKVGTNLYTLDTTTNDFVITPISGLQNDDERYFGLTVSLSIDDETAACLQQDKKTYDYRYIIWDYKSGKILHSYNFDKSMISSSMTSVFYTVNAFYTLENETGRCEKTLNKIALDGTLLFSKYIGNLDSLRNVLVDEKNDVAVFELSTGQDAKKICVYSLDDSFEMKEYYGKLLYKMTRESHKLYYSDEDTIYCVDYADGFSTAEIQAEKKWREEIVELVSIGDRYIMVTKKNYFEFFANFIFEHETFHNYYYSCTLEEDTLKVDELLYVDKQGIFY